MNIKILIADQSKEYLDRLIDKLQEYSELDISIATSYEKLEKAMNNSKYDIILFNVFSIICVFFYQSNK